MKTTPKPCPFCGKAPEVQPKDPETQGNCWGRVKCINKDCPTFHFKRGVYVNDDITINDDRGSHHYVNRAIEIWNTRY